MPVRLIKPYNGQAANTLYWTTGTEENSMRNSNIADDQIELASDYAPSTRIVTTAAATASRTATVYKMNSATAQTLTIPLSGFWPAGTMLTVEQIGTAATTVIGATGVTINTALTSLVTKGQRQIGQLVKEIDGSWTAFGGFGG